MSGWPWEVKTNRPPPWSLGRDRDHWFQWLAESFLPGRDSEAQEERCRAKRATTGTEPAGSPNEIKVSHEAILPALSHRVWLRPGSPRARAAAFTLIMALLRLCAPHKKRWLKVAQRRRNREVTGCSGTTSRTTREPQRKQNKQKTGHLWLLRYSLTVLTCWHAVLLCAEKKISVTVFTIYKTVESYHIKS